MTPVGLILTLLGIAIAYQLVIRLPALVAGGVAVMTAIVVRIRAVRSANEILNLDRTRRADPWAKPSRKERRAMRSGFDLAITTTVMTSLLPNHTLAGYGLARKMGLA